MHTTLDMLLSAQALVDELAQDQDHPFEVFDAAKVCKAFCKRNRLSRK